jgi:hypothetical protein
MVAVHRMIVAVDVVAYGDPRRADPDRVAIRQELYRLLELAFARSGIPWSSADHEDCGDGVLVLVAATVPKSLFADSFVPNLFSLLEEHNSTAGVHERIRLRVALHAGEVHYDAHGVAGTSVNLAFRLLDAPPLKAAVGLVGRRPRRDRLPVVLRRGGLAQPRRGAAPVPAGRRRGERDEHRGVDPARANGRSAAC